MTNNVIIVSSKNLFSVSLFLSLIPTTSILLKRDNKESITLVHRSVFYIHIKYIHIEHHYIYDKVTKKRIDLQYTPMSEIIVDYMTKTLTYVKFYLFVKQICISQIAKEQDLKELIRAKRYQKTSLKMEGQKSRTRPKTKSNPPINWNYKIPKKATI